MLEKEFQQLLRLFVYKAKINQRYYKKMEFLYGTLEVCLKGAVTLGILASLIAELRGRESLAVAVGCQTLFMSVLAHILPLANKQVLARQFYTQWTDLVEEALHLKTMYGSSRNAVSDVPQRFLIGYDRLMARVCNTESLEPSPWRWMLLRAQGDENESRFGWRWQEDEKRTAGLLASSRDKG